MMMTQCGQLWALRRAVLSLYFPDMKPLFLALAAFSMAYGGYAAKASVDAFSEAVATANRHLR